MKINTKGIIFMGVLTILGFVRCVDDDVLPQQKTGIKITVEEAKRYFDSSVTEFRVFPKERTRSIEEELIATPMWNDAKVLDWDDKMIVEIPVEAPMTVIRDVEGPNDTLSNSKQYANTVVSLLAEKGADGKILFTIAKLTGEGRYLLRHDKKFTKMRFGTLNDFSGSIRYYTLKGVFINGNVYENGKITATISNYSPTTRAMTRAWEEQCEVHYFLIEDYRCTDTYVGGELMNSSCELVDSWIETEYVCDVVEVPDEPCPYCGKNPCECNQGVGGGGTESGEGAAATRNVDALISPNSKLTKEQKQELEKALVEVRKYPLLSKVFDALVNDNVKIDFVFFPTLPSSAQYVVGKNEIRITNDIGTNYIPMREELVHAFQENCCYHNNMKNDVYDFNVEVEAKAIVDAATFLKAGSFNNLDSTLIMDSGPGELADATKALMLSIIANQGFSQEQMNLYEDVAKRWSDYSGTYLPGFPPNALLNLFK